VLRPVAETGECGVRTQHGRRGAGATLFVNTVAAATVAVKLRARQP
jgi:hypothetical protein